MSGALWSAERFGDADGPVVAVFVHGGFWRARWAADTIAPLARACAAAEPRPWVWNVEYPRVGMPGGGWPGTALAVREALGAAVDGGRRTAGGGHRPLRRRAPGVCGRPTITRSPPPCRWPGVCDLEEGVDTGIGNGAVLELLGAAPDSDLYAAASPIARLPLGSPALLIHGDADEDVPVSQSRLFHKAARAAGDDCELHELPGRRALRGHRPRGPGVADPQRAAGGAWRRADQTQPRARLAAGRRAEDPLRGAALVFPKPGLHSGQAPALRAQVSTKTTTT